LIMVATWVCTLSSTWMVDRCKNTATIIAVLDMELMEVLCSDSSVLWESKAQHSMTPCTLFTTISITRCYLVLREVCSDKETI
jgi:hypothetical protein